MLTPTAEKIMTTSKTQGWVLEPEAKRLLSLAGLPVPRYLWAKTAAEAEIFAGEIGFPVVAKIVSAEIVHKSDQGGVVVGIANAGQLAEVFARFSRLPGFAGVLVEEMITGLELIVGAKIDFQFGPVILLGMGGTRAEIYRDVTLRMAPLNEVCIGTMIKTLRAYRLLEGYRGEAPINLEALSRLMILFSQLVMDMEERIESIDLNPVLCSSERCVIADARIMLK
ncbi:MAG: acetate--CoA ligase family protein [Deltaproteobacteria bacterium]|nr:acetate--CoA ligase family protein [Deltaproteobacteria bacterium]